MPGGWGSPMDHNTEWLDDWQRVAPCQVSACQNLPRYLSKDYVGLESQITMIPWTHPSQFNPTQQILLRLGLYLFKKRGSYNIMPGFEPAPLVRRLISQHLALILYKQLQT